MIVTTIVASLFLATQISAGPSLSLFVDGPDSITDVDTLVIETTVRNTGDETLKLFNDPRSAMTSFNAQTFFVSHVSGAIPEFYGPKVKYVFNPTGGPEEFTVLAPGATHRVSHDLAGVYNFTRSGEGLYILQADDVFHFLDEAGNVQSLIASESKTHNVRITGSLSSKVALGGVSESAAGPSFVSCSADRKALITTALETTRTYVGGAVTYLKGLHASSERFTTWFGPFSASSTTTVLNHYVKINTSDPSTYTYDCSCTEDHYAHVFPNNFGYIYLCNKYWLAPNNGTDSKAGTIVHEASHFTRNGGTQDHAYGQAKCKDLAKTSPQRAMSNADSHEYFAENTPIQS